MNHLYAWAIPANAIGSVADHTWVTTFDTSSAPYSTLSAVAAAGECLWMCWGSFHPRGGTRRIANGLLASAAARLELARCLVQPNADSRRVAAARGTIQRYGVDGVCHQVSNQVLLATSVATSPPLTVRGARGYVQSVFVFGPYGLARAAWQARLTECGGTMSQTSPPGTPDEFVERAREVLRGREDLLAQLMALRDAHQVRLREQLGRAGLRAEDLNRQNRDLMRSVAALIGPSDLEAIFDVDGGVGVDLVDPAVFAASRDGSSLV